MISGPVNRLREAANSAALWTWKPCRSIVRAGSILPLGPVKQYDGEKIDQPLSISIYPGADASFLFYEDDGKLIQLPKR